MSISQPGPHSDITKTSLVLVAPDGARRRSIAKTIAGTAGRIVREFDQYPAGINLTGSADPEFEVVIVDLEPDIEQGLTLIEAICSRNSGITVMAVSSGNDSALLLRAMRAGAREFLPAPLSASAANEAFARAALRRQAKAKNKATGKLLVFAGSKGGTGVTTLASNFSIALKNESGQDIVLVDLNFQLGEVALGLGIIPQFSVADALKNASRLDADFLSTLLSRHPSGLYVLASPDEYGLDHPFEAGAQTMFQILRQEFAFVVVDAGSCPGRLKHTLIDTADEVYLVTEINLPSLRNANRMISYFSSKEGAPGIELILNRYNSREVEIDEESAIKALTQPIDWRIPNDFMAVRRSQNLGSALVSENSPISRVISQMARSACGKQPSGRENRVVAKAKGEKWKFWTSNSIKPLYTEPS